MPSWNGELSFKKLWQEGHHTSHEKHLAAGAQYTENKASILKQTEDSGYKP